MTTTVVEKPIVKSKFTNPVITNPSIAHAEIVQRLALGNTMQSIANQYNISRQRVGQLSKDYQEEIDIAKALLKEKYAPTYIKRSIIENEKALVITEQDGIPTEEEETFLTRQDKKGQEVMKSVRIYDTNTMSVHIGDHIETKVITPEFQQFIDYQTDNNGVDTPQHEAIDADNGEGSSDNDT